jgi:hypothetical protein
MVGVRRCSFFALALVVMLGGFSAGADELVPAGRAHVYGIYSMNKTGEFGTATLTPIDGGGTEVDIALVGAPEGELQPVNIFSGTCSRLSAHPKYVLNYGVSGVSRTLLNVQMTVLTGGGFAINVHKSTSDVESFSACGGLTGK